MIINCSINEDAHLPASALKASVKPPTILRGICAPLSYSAVERQLKMLQTSVDKASNAILITKAEPADEMDQRIMYVNKAFTAMTGYRIEKVLGQTARQLQERCTNVEVADGIRWTFQQSRSVKVELLDRCNEGSRFWMAVNIVPVTKVRD